VAEETGVQAVTYKPAIVAAYYRHEGLPDPEFEVCHIPGRKFRLDVAWPAAKVGIEVEGGIWTRGKHGRGTGIRVDMEKNNLALIYGWRVLRVEPQDVCLRVTVNMIKSLLRK
jgi:very-short-patch-repair endonuclease